MGTKTYYLSNCLCIDNSFSVPPVDQHFLLKLHAQCLSGYQPLLRSNRHYCEFLRALVQESSTLRIPTWKTKLYRNSSNEAWPWLRNGSFLRKKIQISDFSKMLCFYSIFFLFSDFIILLAAVT